MKESVFILFQMKPNPLILGAEPGIGTTKFALPAQMDGSSMLIKFVLLYLINAKLMIQLEIVLNATKDMI